MGLSVQGYVVASVALAAATVGYESTRARLRGNASSWDMAAALFSSSFGVLVCGNLVLAMLVGLFRALVAAFLGHLRPPEVQLVRERTFNYVVFKAVFVLAVLEPGWADLGVWTTWFAVLGVMKLLSAVALHRFQQLAVNPATPWAAHRKILQLQLLVLLADIAWASLGVLLFYEAGLSDLALLLYECVIVAIRACHGVFKHALHVMDMNRNGLWQRRHTLEFYSELAVDTAFLVTTLAHYGHIFVLNGISLTLIDGIIFMNVRRILSDLRHKFQSYRNYLRVARDMETRFPRATEAECADAGGSCAICLQPLADARRLPCNHVFHLMCLRQWLQRVEANNTCPVCRQSVHGHQDRDHAAPAPPAAAAGAPAGAGAAGGDGGAAAAADGAAGGGAAVTPEAMAAATAAVEGLGLRRRVPARPTPTAAAAPPTATAGAGAPAPPAAAAPPAGTRRVAVARGVDFGHESLFHFSTEGWGQWLPNLSFQVVTNRDGGGGVDPAAAVADEAAAAGGAGGLLAMLRGLGRPTLTPEQVANMRAQVLEVFPHLSPPAIDADLRATGSVEATIENALQGRIVSAMDDPQLFRAPANAQAADAAGAAPAAAPAPAPAAAAAPAPAPGRASRMPRIIPSPAPAPAPAATPAVSSAPAVASATGSASAVAAPTVAGAGAGAGAGGSTAPRTFNPAPDLSPDAKLKRELATLNPRDYFGIVQARKRALARAGRRLWLAKLEQPQRDALLEAAQRNCGHA